MKKHLKDQSIALTCFKAYDVRGEFGVNFDAAVAYRIGRALAQHFQATNIVIGFDARETSPELAAAVMRGICEAGSNVRSIGLAGTEEMYWAVTEFNACAGIEITASHNPINYNGLKIVKSGSQPLDDVLSLAEIFALSLARAEVQLRRTHLALAASGDLEDPMLRELSELETKQILYTKIMAHAETPKLFWQAIKLSARLDQRRMDELQIFINRRRRLLRRHHSEAKSKRRTAFKNWCAYLEAPTEVFRFPETNWS